MNIAINTEAFYDRRHNSNSVSVQDLAQALYDAKSLEVEAINRRRALEAELAARLKKIEEGSFTERVGDFKISVSYPVDRKLDLEALDAIPLSALPEHARPVKAVRELDLKKMRALKDASPEMYRVFASALTSKPGKVAVKVELSDE